MESLNELRLTAEDFTVKAIIGRGHFGEVSIRIHMYVWILHSQEEGYVHVH